MNLKDIQINRHEVINILIRYGIPIEDTVEVTQTANLIEIYVTQYVMDIPVTKIYHIFVNENQNIDHISYHYVSEDKDISEEHEFIFWEVMIEQLRRYTNAPKKYYIVVPLGPICENGKEVDFDTQDAALEYINKTLAEGVLLKLEDLEEECIWIFER